MENETDEKKNFYKLLLWDGNKVIEYYPPTDEIKCTDNNIFTYKYTKSGILRPLNLKMQNSIFQNTNFCYFEIEIIKIHE